MCLMTKVCNLACMDSVRPITYPASYDVPILVHPFMGSTVRIVVPAVYLLTFRTGPYCRLRVRS